MTPAEEEIVCAMREELALHPGLAEAPGGRAFLRGAREWLFFHAPRLARNFAQSLARNFVREAAERVRARGAAGEPPCVPECVRAIWAAPAVLPGGGAA